MTRRDRHFSYLRRLGLEAAREITNQVLDPRSVEIVEGQDSTDEPAYFYTFRMAWDVPVEEQVAGTVQLGLLLRDRLLGDGDDHYPYVTIKHPARSDTTRSSP